MYIYLKRVNCQQAQQVKIQVSIINLNVRSITLHLLIWCQLQNFRRLSQSFSHLEQTEKTLRREAAVTMKALDGDSEEMCGIQ